MQIIGSPRTVTNATLGGTALFECILDSVFALPAWNINGNDYQVTKLPLGHTFISESYSKVLLVGPLNAAMNNSCYYCYVVNYQGIRLESSRAKLIIQWPTMDTYSTTIKEISSFVHLEGSIQQIAPLFSSSKMMMSSALGSRKDLYNSYFLTISTTPTHVCNTNITVIPTLSNSQQSTPTHSHDAKFNAKASPTYTAVAISAGAALVVVSVSFIIVVSTWLCCKHITVIGFSYN